MNGIVGASGLILNEPLLWEKGGKGRRGMSMVAAEVPKTASTARFAREYAVSGNLKPGQSTTVAMGVNVISGMVGKLLLGRSREHVLGQRDHYQLRGMSKEDIERAVFWDAVTLDAMAKWRKIHIPIFIVFAVLALGHIISIFLFWGWA